MTKVMHINTARHLNDDEPLPCCHPRCLDEARPDVPVPLCNRHVAQVVRYWESIKAESAPAVLLAVTQSMVRSGEAAAERQERSSLVYFVRLRDLIKIGTTTNLTRRLRCLPYDELIKTIPGGPAIERQWHNRFVHLRHTREWFRAEPELLAAIAAA